MRTKLNPTESFGLIAWLEQTRVSLPLKGVESRFDVTAGVAGVELDQIYHQTYSSPLDCTYTFPLPDGAAVYRCELHVNGRVIRAIVREEAEARRIYTEQKAAGHRAALVESVRPNLFTLSLGNVQPGDVVVVRLAWFQTLERGGADEVRLRIPLNPGQRYIPGKPLLRSNLGEGTTDDTDQVPDASRITPPRIDAFHPDAAYIHVEGMLAYSDAAEGTLSSPTHPLVATAQGATWKLRLAVVDAVPDRDIVIAWREPVARLLEPRAWRAGRDGATFALVQLRAPAEAPIATEFSQDCYFLVDRSGSMSGAKWDKTCEALAAFVDLLGDRDRVWITLFESSHQDFAEAPMPPAQLRSDPAFRSLAKLGVAGGTELVPAAEHVLQQVSRHSIGRQAVVVIITDGQVGDEDAVLSTFRPHRAVTVFTFGIDTAVNDALLKRLAAQHGGACRLQTPDDDITSTVARLAARLRRPVVTDLAVSGAWLAAPERLPNLFAGETVDLCFRSTHAAETIELEGRLPDGTPHRLSLALEPSANPAIPLLWARENMAELELHGDRAMAVRVGVQYNLLGKGTSFVAWDEAEKVEVATRALVQPCLEEATILYDICAAKPAMCLPIASGPSVPPRMKARVPGRSLLKSLFARCDRDSSVKEESLLDQLMSAGVDADLARLISQWAESERAELNSRGKLVAALLKSLRRKTKFRDQLVKLCEEFVEQHLRASPLHPAAEAAVADWKNRLTTVGPS